MRLVLHKFSAEKYKDATMHRYLSRLPAWIVLFQFATTTVAQTQPTTRASTARATESIRTWPTLVEGENAAVPLLTVATKILDPKRRTGMPRLNSVRSWDTIAMPLPADVEAEFRTYRDAFADLLPMLDEIDVRPKGFDWGEPPRRPIVFVGDWRPTHPERGPRTVGVNAVARVLYVDGLLAFGDGDIERGWRRGEQLACIADARRQWPQDNFTLIARLIDRDACRLFEIAAAQPGFKDFARVHGGRLRKKARSLDDERIALAWYDAWLATERAILEDTLAAFADGWKAPKRTELDEASAAARETIAGRLPRFAPELKKCFDLADSLIDRQKPLLLATMGPSTEVQSHVYQGGVSLMAVAGDELAMLANARHDTYKHLARRRLTGTALAARIYAIEHNEQLPATLEVLVPDLLPSVPLDPLAKQVTPLGYDASRGLIWSTGDDGEDHQGLAATDEMTYGQRQQTDIVVRLRGATSDR
jgi:hypothetical protein